MNGEDIEKVWMSIRDKIDQLRTDTHFRDFYSLYLTESQRVYYWKYFSGNGAGFNSDFYSMCVKRGERLGKVVERRTEIE